LLSLPILGSILAKRRADSQIWKYLIYGPDLLTGQEEDKLKKVVSRSLSPVFNDLEAQLKECKANCGTGQKLFFF
jgi:hypothetical protein